MKPSFEKSFRRDWHLVLCSSSFFSENFFKLLKKICSLGLEWFTGVPRDGADKILRQIIGWHFAPLLVDNLKIQGVHNLLHPVEHLGMSVAQFFYR
jgi:hypothetical protein